MEIWISDGNTETMAREKTTRLAIVAHQDDVEILAYSGIQACYKNEEEGFSAIILTSGVNSPRKGKYKEVTGAEMREIRRQEQINAAKLGDYRSLTMLGYESSAVKNNEDTHLVEELSKMILEFKPTVIYTHNLADKHETHVAVAMRVLEALKSIRDEYRPEKLYGCEVWRGLDWVMDEDKVLLDTSNRPDLALGLLKVFESQIDGGKRYDLAEIGRRHANVTFASSHEVDELESGNFAIDMTKWIEKDSLKPEEIMEEYIEKLKADIIGRIQKMEGGENENNNFKRL